jgi:hypothetical protein
MNFSRENSSRGHDYFCRQETREQGGIDRVVLGKIYFRCGDDRSHSGYNCFVDTNNQIIACVTETVICEPKMLAAV